jgi:acyl-CoA thioesterase FadM
MTFKRTFRILFSDFDPHGYISSATFSRWFQDSRADYLNNFSKKEKKNLTSNFKIVVANISLVILKHITFFEMEKVISISIETTNIGNSSMLQEYKATIENVLYATAKITLVHVEEGKPIKNTSNIIELFENFENKKIQHHNAKRKTLPENLDSFTNLGLVKPRFHDYDLNKHLNNVKILGIFFLINQGLYDEAMCNVLRRVGVKSFNIKETDCQFLKQIGSNFEVFLKVEKSKVENDYLFNFISVF